VGCRFSKTVISNLFVTGVAAVIVGLVFLVWSLFFVQHRYGG